MFYGVAAEGRHDAFHVTRDSIGVRFVIDKCGHLCIEVAFRFRLKIMCD